jgi:hypothetical protein
MRMLHLGKQINKLPEVFDNNAENSNKANNNYQKHTTTTS